MATVCLVSTLHKMAAASRILITHPFTPDWAEEGEMKEGSIYNLFRNKIASVWALPTSSSEFKISLGSAAK